MLPYHLDHLRHERKSLSLNDLHFQIYVLQTSHTADIKTSVLFYCGKPALVSMDYQIEGNKLASEFRLSYYPHELKRFTEILSEIFGKQAKHKLYGDFKEMTVVQNPAFYIHLIEKPYL